MLDACDCHVPLFQPLTVTFRSAQLLHNFFEQLLSIGIQTIDVRGWPRRQTTALRRQRQQTSELKEEGNIPRRGAIG